MVLIFKYWNNALNSSEHIQSRILRCLFKMSVRKLLKTKLFCVHFVTSYTDTQKSLIQCDAVKM